MHWTNILICSINRGGCRASIETSEWNASSNSRSLHKIFRYASSTSSDNTDIGCAKNSMSTHGVGNHVTRATRCCAGGNDVEIGCCHARTNATVQRETSRVQCEVVTLQQNEIQVLWYEIERLQLQQETTVRNVKIASMSSITKLWSIIARRHNKVAVKCAYRGNEKQMN